MEPFEIAGGKATHGKHVIVRLSTRRGEVGYGESAPMSSYSSQTQESVTSEIERLKGLLIGRNPLDIEKMHMAMGSVGADCFALAGIDVAMHDLAAKAMGVPICRLLGGPVTEEMELSWAIGFKPVDAMVAEAKRQVRMGFRTVKIKVGDDPEVDLERAAAVREALGKETRIKVDANQGYDLPTAIKVGRKLRDYGISIIEQPLPREQVADLAKLRQEIDIPIMVDESIYDTKDAMRIIQGEAADVFNIKIMKPGGIRPSWKLAAVAEAAGMPCMLGSMPELGIGTLGGLQLAVTSPVFSYGAELIGPWMFEEDLLKERPQLVDGRMLLPKGVGLGIEVDEPRIEALSKGSILA